MKLDFITVVFLLCSSLVFLFIDLFYCLLNRDKAFISADRAKSKFFIRMSLGGGQQ